MVQSILSAKKLICYLILIIQFYFHISKFHPHLSFILTEGKIIWSQFLPDFSPYHSKDGGERTVLFVQRGTAHFPLPPQCVAVGKKKSGKGTLVYAFNPLTGKPADKDHPNGLLFPYDIVQVSLLPLTGKGFPISSPGQS